MTQQYIVGEFSLLLADISETPPECRPAVEALRHRVEAAPVGALPELAREAMSLTHQIGWVVLDHGVANDVARYAKSARALREFLDSAGILS